MKCEIKYAPTNLNEVIYPSNAVELRIKGYAAGELEGHVMLHGPNGTGKTTLGKLMVEAIGGPNAILETLDFEELLSKPDLRRFLLQSSALARSTTSGKHFLLLNEFDQAKKDIHKFWTALDACGDQLMAIITTNEPMKVHGSVRSRCDVIDMPGITAVAALPRVQFALQSEGLQLPDKQTLYYLKTKEQHMDLRKYFRLADELLYLHRNNHSLPQWNRRLSPLKIV